VNLHAEREALLAADGAMTDQLARTEENIAAIETALEGAKNGMVSFGDAIVDPIKLSDRLSKASKGAGEEAEKAAKKMASGADEVARGWGAVLEAMDKYADETRNIGKGVSDSLTNAFGNAERAFSQFVETGKIDFKSFARSIASDLAMLAARQTIFGPLASMLAGAFSPAPMSSPLPIPRPVAHSGGVVGGPMLMRPIPNIAFAGARRMHRGGWSGLAPDEVPAILQRGERVLARGEGMGSAPAPVTMSINVDARGAQAGVAEQIERRLQRFAVGPEAATMVERVQRRRL